MPLRPAFNNASQQNYISVRPGIAPAGFVDKEKNRDIAKPQIKICDAVIKEEPMSTRRANERRFAPWLAL